MSSAEWIAKRRREHAQAWDRSDMIAAYDALPKALDTHRDRPDWDDYRDALKERL